MSVHNQISVKVRADCGAGVSILVWGMTALLCCLLSHLPASQVLVLPLILGGAVSLCFERRLPRLFVRCWRHWAAAAALGGNISLYLIAFRIAPPAQVDLFYYLWPLMVVVSQCFTRRERLISIHWVGLLLAFSGPALLVVQQFSEGGFSLLHLAGYSLALLSGGCWAFYSVMTRDKEKMGSSLGDHQLLVGILALAVTLLFGGWQSISRLDFGLMFVLGVAVYGIGCPLWVNGMRNGHYLVIGAMANSVPLLSILFLVIGGWVEATSLLGVATLLVMGGSVLVGSHPPRLLSTRKKSMISALS